MDNNLVSLNKLKNDIKFLKFFSLVLPSKQKKEIKDMEKKIEKIISQIAIFNERFSSYGWCAYDSMNLSLIENANLAFEKNGLNAGEQVLLNYYKSDVKKIIGWLKNSSEAFAMRSDLIQRFFEDHFAERYHASIPLGLIIVDGAVNDFTKSKGFFAEGTEVDAWDCLVGCSDGLSKLKKIFNQKRTKTNTDMITVPYRNGILHGRDLNYANEYVSCKCICLMLAVADWMKMKRNEEERKKEFEKSLNPPPLKDTFSHLVKIRKQREEISKWEKKTIIIGKDIPAQGEPGDYSEYPYVEEVVKMLYSWKERNYGKLSMYLKKMFPTDMSDGKRAGECRKYFEKKQFETFEIIEVEERGWGLSKVRVKVLWVREDNKKESILTFGCCYESDDNENIGIPWKNNGKWVLNPWDIHDLYL